MTNYSKKIFLGEPVTAKDWQDHLLWAHEQSPSMSPKAFSEHQTASGLNSYQLLAQTLSNLNPKYVLDLACGDGHLIPYLQTICPKNTQYTGIDLSSAELSLAKSKKILNNVNFRQEGADKISDQDNHYDAVLCHMALMLMSPIEPIIHEISRVLKPGGLLTAVVARKTQQHDFFKIYQNTVSEFYDQNYPKFDKIIAGETRFYTEEGILDIFNNSPFKHIQSTSINLKIDLLPEKIWTVFQDMYFIGLLPNHKKNILKTNLIHKAREHCNSHGHIQFNFPMRLIIAKKPY